MEIEKMENIKNQAIQDVLNAVREQMKKDGIVAGDMHFNRIKYIQKDENGNIIISYPMEKGTYHNYCQICVEPDGRTNIHGVQTSPEKRKGVTRTGNGSFDINLTIDNWQETESISAVTEQKYGRYEPVRGILEIDSITSVRVDCNKMFAGIGEKYGFRDDKDYQTYGWEGCGLPSIPNIERFEYGVDVLTLSPRHATELLRAAKREDYSSILIYTNCYGYSDCYDIALGDLDLFVMDTDGIEGQDKESIEEEYREYRDAVLDCLKSKVRFDYVGIISKQLSEDSIFIEQVTQMLKENPNNSTLKILKKTFGLTVPLTYTFGEIASFKQAIVEMTAQDPSLNINSITSTIKKVEDATIDYEKGPKSIDEN